MAMTDPKTTKMFEEYMMKMKSKKTKKKKAKKGYGK